MSDQNVKKTKKWLLPAILAGTVVFLGATAAIVLPKVLRGNQATADTEMSGEESGTEVSEDTPYDGPLYWNVDRLKYDGKSEVGLSSRVPSKEDGLYHILLASEGRQSERRTANKQLVNQIDRQDVFGLRFDENRLISEVVPIQKIMKEFTVNGWYVKEIREDGTIVLNSSSLLNGMEDRVLNLSAYRFYDVSGTSGNYIGAYIGSKGLQEKDRIFAMELLNGEFIAFVTERYVDVPVYWVITRQWDSRALTTTRVPNENGEYEIEVALNGEQLVVKCKDLSVVNTIDENPAHCLTFTFDEEGYVSAAMDSAYALKGPVFGSWYHVTSVDGRNIAVKKVSSGQTAEGVLAEDAKIFDVSPTAEYVGVPTTDLRVTDQVHGLTDQSGEIRYLFIIRRLTDVPIYWNHLRYYNSETKSTTRTPDANGWYWFDVSVNGTVQRLRTNDKAIATKVDSYNTKCMGLITDGDIILDTATAEYLTCTGRGKSIASWYYVTSVSDATHFHAKNSKGTAEADVVLAPNCQIYNVSKTTLSHIGEPTTVQVGDQVHCLLNLDDQVSVVFVVGRNVNVPIYWNVARWYNSTTKETSRTPDAEGYYHILMATGGQQVELRTNSKSIASSVDSYATKCMGLSVSGDIITKVYPAEAVANSTGVIASWYDVTAIYSANKFRAKKTTQGADYGKEVDVVMAAGCKVYNVGGLYSFCGEETTLRVGDRVHCLTNKNKEATTVFVVLRTAPDRTALCPDCGKEVTWTAFTNTVASSADGPVHYYLAANSAINAQVSVPANTVCHFDMNGFNLTAPKNDRAVVPWNTGSELVIMNLKTGSEARLIAGNGSINGTRGALIWLRYSTNKLTIRDVTIDLSEMNSRSTGAIDASSGELVLKNVKILGAKQLFTSGALIINAKATLENVTVTGGYAIPGAGTYEASYPGVATGNLYIGPNATVTFTGDVRFTGGRTEEGERNVYLAAGKRITIGEGGLTSPAGSIGLSAKAPGEFTAAGMSAYQEIFRADLQDASIGTTEDGNLTLDFEVIVTPPPATEHTHPEGTNAAIHANEGVPAGYTAWTDGTMIPTESGYWYLTTDVTITDRTNPEIPAGREIHLCLNGHKILNATEGAEVTIDMIGSGSTLTITDCSDGETGSVEAEGTSARSGRAILVRGSNALNLYGGRYVGAETTSSGGGGTLAMETNAVISLYGGTVTGGSSSDKGGNVYVPGTFRMYGGTISGGFAKRGGNIFVTSSGKWIQTGGTVTGGNASGSGGNIYFYGSELRIENASFTAGHSGGSGGNILITGETSPEQTIAIRNLTTGGNSVSDTAARANDIHINGAAETITIADSTLEAMNLMGVSSLTLSGKMTIGSEGAGYFFINNSSPRRVIAGTLDPASRIYLDSLNLGVLIEGGTPYLSSFLQIRGEEYELRDKEGSIEFVLKPVEDPDPPVLTEHKHCICGGTLKNKAGHTCDETVVWKPWTATSVLPVYGDLEATGTTYYYLVNDVNLQAEWRPALESNGGSTYVADMGGRELVLCLNGKTVTSTKTTLLSSATSSGHAKKVRVTVTDCGATGTVKIAGSSTNKQPAFAYFNESDCRFTLYAGLLDATEFSIPVQTGGVYGVTIKLLKNAEFVMHGGTISGGTAHAKTANVYGGIYADTGASITIHGGLITGGTIVQDEGATKSGFGGNLSSDGKVTIDGGTIENGAAKYGGNICLKGVSTISNATIRNGGGTVAAAGGNVYLSGSGLKAVTFTNTILSGGTCSDAGGNLCVSGNMTVTLNSLTLTGGSAGSAGKADLHINAATAEVTLKDAVVTGGMLAINATSVTLTGNTKIGTDTTVGLALLNTGSNHPNIVASELGAEAKIRISPQETGTVVTNGAAFLDRFELSKEGNYELKAEGDDLVLSAAE